MSRSDASPLDERTPGGEDGRADEEGAFGSSDDVDDEWVAYDEPAPPAMATAPGATRRLRPGRPSREAFSTRVLTFDVEGDSCAGTLWIPRDVDDPSTVVMGHALAAEASFGLDRVAERLAGAGYAAFAFDYRGFGASEGESVVVPSRQIDDFDAAVDRVRRVDALGDGVALWGFSLGGGHAVSVAADRFDVDCAIARSPFADGRKLLRTKSPVFLAKSTEAGLVDRVGALAGRPNHVKVYGDPDEFALLNEPGAKEGYAGLIPDDSDWRNETRARVALALPRYRPVSRAEDVSCPTLVVAGTDDEVTPYSAAQSLVDGLPEGSLVALPMDHFGSWGEEFVQTLAHEVAFLDAHLGVGGDGRGGRADGRDRSALSGRSALGGRDRSAD